MDRENKKLSIRNQCKLLGISRSGFYQEKRTISEDNLKLMNVIDEWYTQHPEYGRPKMTKHLRRLGYLINPKRVRRLMRMMGIQAVYAKPRTSIPNSAHRIYPYLLRDLTIDCANQVWCADITYIRLTGGFMYLVVVMDWHSRYVLSWELSNTLDRQFCVDALNSALAYEKPEIFNTDQGVQFTSEEFTSILQQNEIKISMDGKGRCMDNIVIERLWRSVKYEDIFLKQYPDVESLYHGLTRYFDHYNNTRIHQGLNYQTPAEVFYKKNTISKEVVQC